MGLIQKLFKSVLSADGMADMEAESRAWMMQCTSCGHEISVWDAGGIRYGAAGKPKRLMRCSKCGKLRWHRTYKKTDDQPQESAKS
jgi:uncharacterized protein with PIN domain